MLWSLRLSRSLQPCDLTDLGVVMVAVSYSPLVSELLEFSHTSHCNCHHMQCGWTEKGTELGLLKCEVVGGSCDILWHCEQTGIIWCLTAFADTISWQHWPYVHPTALNKKITMLSWPSYKVPVRSNLLNYYLLTYLLSNYLPRQCDMQHSSTENNLTIASMYSNSYLYIDLSKILFSSVQLEYLYSVLKSFTCSGSAGQCQFIVRIYTFSMSPKCVQWEATVAHGRCSIQWVRGTQSTADRGLHALWQWDTSSSCRLQQRATTNILHGHTQLAQICCSDTMDAYLYKYGGWRSSKWLAASLACHTGRESRPCRTGVIWSRFWTPAADEWHYSALAISAGHQLLQPVYYITLH